MKAPKALRAILFTFILTAGLLLPALISTPVLAESSSGQTTLYFTDALNYAENDNFSEFGFAFVSQTSPTKQNDSEYPPSLFIKNTSKLIPRYSSNADQWFNWFSSTWLLYFIENSPDFNFSDFDGIFGDFELLLPNPYRVVEEYTYNGDDPVKINGDLFYNLYFASPIKRQKFRDNVTVGLYSMNMNSALPLPTLIKNTTVELTPELFSDIYNQQITLKNINHTLEPGESLLFTVEIVPCNKTLPALITKYIDLNRFISRLEERANKWENRSNIQKLQDIGTALKDILSLLKESNITSEDFAAIINVMRSSSFIYDSANHPASVTIPAKISEEDIRIYYLHAIPEMNENRPVTDNQSGSVEITETPTLWTSETFDRNKILKVGDISADLYLDHRDFYRIINILRGKITITATLYDKDAPVASSEKELDITGIREILTKPNTPVTFTFSGLDKEITYGHSIGIGLSLKNGTKLGLRNVKLLFDSVDYPSALRVKLEETKNIKITDITSNPPSQKIIPGGIVEYILNVTSEKADTLQISTIEREKTGDWEITSPRSATVSANSWTNIHVFIKSLSDLNEAYGNAITLTVIVNGNTGIARQAVSAEISEDAIQYDVEILGYSNNINISKGENRTFYFVIKNNNTGAIDDVDSYTISASSKNDWRLIPRDIIRNLGIGASTDADDARVVIQVPKNTTLDSDIITIIVTSDGDPSTTATINVTVHVIGGDFLESIYNLFDGAAETLGLKEIFGSYGAIVLASILMVIILFLLIILALVFTTKHVRIICADRIKEIEKTEKAIYELTLQNPSKKTQSYEILAQQTAPSSKWMIAIEPLTITIDGRQSKTIQIIVTPINNNESKDWTQVTVHVKKTGKKKTEYITLIAMVKEGKTLLKLDNVSHWPTVFNSGEKVTTSCSISNNGTVSARNVKVFFYLNGKQKNMVEVTIPAGSIADLQIPWMAVKGKNQVRIRLKE
jgi:uncharacterized membrane protein